MRKKREANPIILNDTSRQRLAEWENKMKLQEQQVNDWLKRIIAVRKNIILLKKNLENKDIKLLVKLIQFLLKQKMLRMVIFIRKNKRAV